MSLPNKKEIQKAELMKASIK